MKRVIILIIGGIFIVLGLLGLALPFLQGFLFLAIGLVLISLYSTTVRGWTDKHRKRHPKLHTVMEKMDAWVASIIGRP